MSTPWDIQSPALLRRLTVLVGEEQAAAVLAELTPELAAWAEYENAITWHTECLSCSNMLTTCIKETVRAEQAETDRDIALKNLANHKGSHLSLQHDYHHALGDVYAMQHVRALVDRWYASDDLGTQIAARILDEKIGHREACKGRGKCQWMEAATADACRCKETPA